MPHICIATRPIQVFQLQKHYRQRSIMPHICIATRPIRLWRIIRDWNLQIHAWEPGFVTTRPQRIPFLLRESGYRKLKYFKRQFIPVFTQNADYLRKNLPGKVFWENILGENTVFRFFLTKEYFPWRRMKSLHVWKSPRQVSSGLYSPKFVFSQRVVA